MHWQGQARSPPRCSGAITVLQRRTLKFKAAYKLRRSRFPRVGWRASPRLTASMCSRSSAEVPNCTTEGGGDSAQLTVQPNPTPTHLVPAALIDGVVGALNDENDENNVVPEARNPVHPRHLHNEREEVVDEGVQRLVDHRCRQGRAEYSTKGSAC